MSQYQDITGQRFGRLTVVEPVRNGKILKWLCRCDCGGETITTSWRLRSGHTKSCGCFQREQTSLASAKDYTGLKFGRLTVKKRIAGAHTRYQCICECGKTVVVSGNNLVCGATRSCGCLRSEMVTESNTIHGGCGTRLYIIWRNMQDRCYNPKNKEYHRYGGRGINICPEWQTSFAVFREWALENGYQENLTIDRINNDLGYFPSNCQWLTLRENIAKMNTERNHHPKEIPVERHSDAGDPQGQRDLPPVV